MSDCYLTDIIEKTLKIRRGDRFNITIAANNPYVYTGTQIVSTDGKSAGLSTIIATLNNPNIVKSLAHIKYIPPDLWALIVSFRDFGAEDMKMVEKELKFYIGCECIGSIKCKSELFDPNLIYNLDKLLDAGLWRREPC